MKTFKKLFAYSAIFALLATMMPTYANAASYDAELTEAYAYAKGKSITTMDSIDNADMYGNLTRVAMAKMVANYVLDLGLQELDTTKECTFPDVSEALDAAYDNGVTKACQLGLMGVGIEKFNPNGIVTRAEFGTVLSRALWGEENNGGNPYYAKHLQALKDEGIMNKIDNPNMKEVRGYVMLMMMRADDAYTPTTGCSAEELLACLTADNFEQCIATCSEDAEEEILPWFVTVSRVGSVDTQSVPYNATLVKVGTVKLTAGENGARIQSLAITRSGLGNADDIEVNNGIRAAINGVIASSDADFYNSLSQVGNVYFSPALDLRANESMNVDILVTLQTGAAQHSEHSFIVTAVNLSNGTATGVPVSLGTLRTTSYEVSTVNASLTNPATSLEPGKANQSIVDFKLAADTTSSKLQSFAIVRDTAGVDLTKRLANVKAYHNGEEVGNVTVTADKIVVDWLSQTIADGSSKTYELKADILVNSDTANLKLKLNESDIRATEVETNHNVRVATVGTTDIPFGNVFVTFNKKSTGNETVAPWTSNVKLFHWEVKSSTNMFVRELRIASDTANGALTWFTNNQLNVKVNGATVATLVHPITTPKADVSVSFALEANTPVVITIEWTVRDGVAWDPTYKYTVALLDVRDASNNPVTIWTSAVRAGDTTTISAWSVNVKAATVAAPSTSSIYSNASDLEIGRFAIEAKAEKMTVRKITATKAGTFTGELDSAISSIKLVNAETNEEISASVTINTWDIVFDSMNIAVEKDKVVNLKLVAQTNNISANNGQNINFTVVVNIANRQSGWSDAGTWTATTKLYTVGVRPLEVSGEKLTNDKFLITVKNVDSENDITLQTGTLRILPVDAENTFKQPFCVRTQWSTDDCSDLTKKTWEGNKDFDLTSIVPSPLAKNNGIAKFEVFVDSNVQVPDTLELQVRGLQYNGTSETYMVSIK